VNLIEEGDIYLWHGATNAPRRTHLVREGEETTLCDRVEGEYTNTGQINGRKSSEFEGLDHVVGKTCEYCRDEYMKMQRRGENSQ